MPNYKSLPPDARDRWRQYLAQQFEKLKAEVSPADCDRANGWMIPSLVGASLDCGLRPIEVERARTSWVDVDNRRPRIPVRDSAKNRDNWTVSLTDRTARSMAGGIGKNSVWVRTVVSGRGWASSTVSPSSSGL